MKEQQKCECSVSQMRPSTADPSRRATAQTGCGGPAEVGKTVAVMAARVMVARDAAQKVWCVECQSKGQPAPIDGHGLL